MGERSPDVGPGRLSRLLRWPLYLYRAVIGAALAAAAVALLLVVTEGEAWVARFVERELSDALDAPVTIEGAFDYSLGPELRLGADNVRVGAGAPELPEGAVFTRAEADLDLLLLLDGTVSFERVVLTAETLIVDLSDDDDTPDDGRDKEPVPIGAAELSVQDLVLRVGDGSADARGSGIRLTGRDLVLGGPKASPMLGEFALSAGRMALRYPHLRALGGLDVSASFGPGGVLGLKGRGDARIGEAVVPVTIDGTVADYRAFLDGLSTDIALDLVVADLSLGIDGRLADLVGRPKGTASVDVRASGGRGLTALGLEDIADRPVTVTARLGVDGQVYDARDLTLQYGDVTGSGALRLDLGPARPSIAGQLVIDELDLAAFSGDAERSPDAGLAMPGLDAVLDLEIGRLGLDEETTLEKVTGQLSLDAEALSLTATTARHDPARLSLTVAPRDAVAPGAFAIDAAIQRLALAPMLGVTGHLDSSGMTGRMTASLVGRGADADTYLQTARGQVSMGTVGGQLTTGSARWLARGAGAILEPLLKDSPGEQIHCIETDWAVADGRADSTALAAVTDNLIISGSGHIGLRDQTVDMTFAVAPRDPGLFDRSVVFGVVGPIAAPDAQVRSATVLRGISATIAGSVTPFGVLSALAYGPAAEGHAGSCREAIEAGDEPVEGSNGLLGALFSAPAKPVETIASGAADAAGSAADAAGSAGGVAVEAVKEAGGAVGDAVGGAAKAVGGFFKGIGSRLKGDDAQD